MKGESSAVVRVQHVVKDFRPGFGLKRKRVLHGVDFEVQDGEIFGFVGPNGAGKTTTLKILMGLIRPTEGSASILGRNVEESEFRDQIGFLPENPYFYPYLTASEILNFYARLSGVGSADRAARVDELLAMVNLSHAADARLRTFSKGMLQRVGVAQALINDPKVVFLDEPMSGLDPIGADLDLGVSPHRAHTGRSCSIRRPRASSSSRRSSQASPNSVPGCTEFRAHKRWAEGGRSQWSSPPYV